MSELDTGRLILRPVTPADTQAIARLIFSDPDVVAMLAHDTRHPEDATREAARWTGLMGLGGTARIWEQGGLGLFEVVPKAGDGDLAGVAGYYMERDADTLWSGEFFYALGRDWHGHGLMSEAADALAAQLRTLPEMGVIYAAYWDLINEASGRILRRSGLVDCGRKSVVEEYSAERCRAIFDYDLWRLSQSGQDARDGVAVQAARRAGAFAAEGVVSRDQALWALAQACDADPVPAAAIDMFDAAVALPGMAYLEIRGPGATGAPVNRLG